MFTYFKMKRNQWKVKAMFYGTIIGIVDNQKDIIELIKKTYVSLKDTPLEDLKDEIIMKLAEIIHQENSEV